MIDQHRDLQLNNTNLLPFKEVSPLNINTRIRNLEASAESQYQVKGSCGCNPGSAANVFTQSLTDGKIGPAISNETGTTLDETPDNCERCGKLDNRDRYVIQICDATTKEFINLEAEKWTFNIGDKEIR